MKSLTAIVLLLLTQLPALAQTDCPIYGQHPEKLSSRISDSMKNRSRPGTVKKSFDLTKGWPKGADSIWFKGIDYVRVTGYVVDVKYGEPESCNCHSHKKADLDVHIELGPTPGTDHHQGMVVEINRYVLAKHPEYRKDALHPYIGRKVAVEGYVFPDIEHKENAWQTNPKGNPKSLWRQTMWEVHPVIKFTPL